VTVTRKDLLYLYVYCYGVIPVGGVFYGIWAFDLITSESSFSLLAAL
jgi:hypothetical protein